VSTITIGVDLAKVLFQRVKWMAAAWATSTGSQARCFCHVVGELGAVFFARTFHFKRRGKERPTRRSGLSAVHRPSVVQQRGEGD
jgi:hypothetical protein